jgi:PTH2 family peptidyl-tRNA hydrolase
MENIKQVIVIRRKYPDGKGGFFQLRTGKLIAQAAHASMKVLLDKMDFYDVSLTTPPASSPRFAELSMIMPKSGCLYKWLNSPFTKIVVYVDSEEELLEIKQKAEDAGILCALVTDAGKTEFHGEATNTVVAVGPEESEKIDKITGHLRLL